ncbi:FadR/GntR family transcriptional regulator [Rhodophyticola porphyridii]|uniref:FadR family transcriptional regulator n=1 Tax=Rhodophyticola porphyridii TaxID=1852017 RepID=A0A3L9XZ02_9RHOB|nr:GntR family transcriptional regulator [Rhodophyticola porphyridii]RMA41462.1 FadR family transcriptional regulator [Rhodophyticola porphyridii]
MFWTGIRIEGAPFHGIAYDLIKRQVEIGAMRPGEQFPAERKLSESLGISRATLREALKRLEAEGYLVSSRGAKGGNFVADEDQINHLAHTSLLTRPDMAWRSLEYLKAILEEAAVLSCERRTPADLAALEAAHGMLDPARQAGDLREAQYLFFSTLGHSSRNPFFVEGIERSLAGLNTPVRPDSVADRVAEWRPIWRALADAVGNRQPDAAAKSARRLFDVKSREVIAAMTATALNDPPDADGSAEATEGALS